MLQTGGPIVTSPPLGNTFAFYDLNNGALEGIAVTGWGRADWADANGPARADAAARRARKTKVTDFVSSQSFSGYLFLSLRERLGDGLDISSPAGRG